MFTAEESRSFYEVNSKIYEGVKFLQFIDVYSLMSRTICIFDVSVSISKKLFALHSSFPAVYKYMYKEKNLVFRKKVFHQQTQFLYSRVARPTPWITQLPNIVYPTR